MTTLNATLYCVDYNLKNKDSPLFVPENSQIDWNASAVTTLNDNVFLRAGYNASVSCHGSRARAYMMCRVWQDNNHASIRAVRAPTPLPCHENEVYCDPCPFILAPNAPNLLGFVGNTALGKIETKRS